MVGRVVVSLVAVALLLAPAAVEPLGARGQAEGFALVGQSDLGGLGMHGGLALAGDCAYVGGRGAGRGPLVVDVAEPTAPRLVGELPGYPGSTPREVRTAADLDLLVVLTYRLDAAPWASPAAPNGLDLYRIADCWAPALVGRVDFGDALPHEFFLWRDPARRGRLLAFVAMWGSAPNLRVVDLSDPAAPEVVATWDAGSALGLPSRLHSLTVAPDGARAYLAAGRADPALVPLTPPSGALLLPGGNLHSAVPVPGRELVATTQEVYGAGACPYGRLHVVDVSDPAACATTATRDGVFSAHTPTVVGDVAFVSWYAGGLRAVDLSDPAAPVEVGAFLPEPLPAVAADDPTLGAVPVRVWSSPIVCGGLVYVVDIRNGLFVLRYTGPGAEQVGATALAEGNAS